MLYKKIGRRCGKAPVFGGGVVREIAETENGKDLNWERNGEKRFQDVSGVFK
jgi:hypothetical protein